MGGPPSPATARHAGWAGWLVEWLAGLMQKRRHAALINKDRAERSDAPWFLKEIVKAVSTYWLRVRVHMDLALGKCPGGSHVGQRRGRFLDGAGPWDRLIGNISACPRFWSAPGPPRPSTFRLSHHMDLHFHTPLHFHVGRDTRGGFRILTIPATVDRTWPNRPTRGI